MKSEKDDLVRIKVLKGLANTNICITFAAVIFRFECV